MRFDCPLFADELVGRETFEGLQSLSEIVGADEGGEVLAQRVGIVVMKAFDGRGLDRAVHAFNLAIRPWVLDPGQPVVDLMLAADPVEDVFEGMDVPFVGGELAAIIGQNDVDAVRHSGGQVA